MILHRSKRKRCSLMFDISTPLAFPDAGVEEEGLFSVVVSSMTGDVTETTPQTHVCHLVSLENIDSSLDRLASDNVSDRFALISLHSWTYTCIPQPIDFHETMRVLADNAQPLRPPKENLKSLSDGAIAIADSDPPKAKALTALHDRLNAGYTIARWRTGSGEETAAFNRGPITPILTQDVPSTLFGHDDAYMSWPQLSMTGKDYMILDKKTGVMDATYASAWSLGKLMAVSDPVFNAALTRFRSVVWSDATSALRMSANGVPTKSSVLSAALPLASHAQKLLATGTDMPIRRIANDTSRPLAPSVKHPDMSPKLQHAIDLAVNFHVGAGASLSNGFDGALDNNSDWPIIRDWIHDCMFLGHMPYHVIFPEPSHLSSKNPSPVLPGQPTIYPEALRFFYLDHAWIDCFLDGALSCGNHLDPQYDVTRMSIKRIVNEYLDTPVASTGVKPPVPRYGFVIRSAAVKSTPDLKLVVTCWKYDTDQTSPTKNTWIEDPTRDPLVRHTKLDDFTILSLLDCAPEEICVIKFQQPPHQQRFALNMLQDPTTKMWTPDISIKKLYTDKTLAPPAVERPGGKVPDDPDDRLEWPELVDPAHPLTPEDQSSFYDIDSRCIRPMKITSAIANRLTLWGSSGPYTDIVPNSCVFGLEMNDPSCESVTFYARCCPADPHPRPT